MNQFINFFWTIIFFAVVVVYWFSVGLSPHFYIFTAASFIPVFLPPKILAKLQLSNSTGFYERLGVRFIRRFVQHGDIANRISRKSKPGYKVTKQKGNRVEYLKTVAMYERFHLMCFLFFLFTTIAALWEGRIVIASIIMISNILYNLYPVLLQQYNRVRIRRLTKTI